MAIIKYEQSTTVPSYITNSPGNWANPRDSFVIGIGSGGGTELNKTELLAYVEGLYDAYPSGFQKYTEDSDGRRIWSTQTKAEVTTNVNAWCSAKGIS